MPVVPKYESTVDMGVAPDARVTEVATAKTFGGIQAAQLQDFGTAITNASSTAHAIQMEQEDQLARTKAKDAANQFSVTATRIGSQYLTKQGSDAVGKAHSDFEEAIKSGYNSASDALSTPREKELFKEYAGSVMYGSLRQGVEHVVKQEQVYNDQASKGRVWSMTQLAIKNPKGVDLYDSELQQAVREMNLGMPEEFVQSEIGKNLSVFYNEQINALKAADPVGAYAFYKKYKDRIDPSLRDKIEPQVKEAAQEYHALQQAQKWADKDTPYKQVMTEIAKVKDPKERALLESHFQRQTALKNEIKQQRQIEATNGFVAKYISGQASRTDIFQLANSGAVSWSKVPDLIETAEKAKSGVKVVMNWDKHIELFSKSNEEIAKTDLSDYVPYLPPEDLAEAQKWQATVTKATGAEGTVPAGIAIKAGRLTMDKTPDLEVKGSMSQGRKDEVFKLRRQYLYAVETAFRKLPKSEQTQTKAEEIAHDMLTPGAIVYNTIFGVKVPGTSKVRYKFEQIEAPPQAAQSATETSSSAPSLPPNLKVFPKGDVRWNHGVWEAVVHDPTTKNGYALYQYTADGQPINKRR